MHPRLLATRVGPVEVAEAGSGPTILLLHGMPGDWSQALPVARELTADHHVVLVSRPGHGRTPIASGPTPRASATAYAAVLDALGVECATMVGISGGGPSAFEFAAHERDRCAGLALVCAVHPQVLPVPLALRVFHGLPGVREAVATVVHRRRRRGLQDPAAVTAAALAELTEVERARLARDPVLLPSLEEFVQHHLRVSADLSGFRHDLRAIASQRRRAPLAWPEGPDVPATVIHGDADPVVDVACAHAWAALVPGAELLVLPGAGHAVPLTFRDETVSRLRRLTAATA